MAKTNRARKRPRGIDADDLYRLRILTGAAISPDEQQVAFTVERMDKDERKYFQNIFIVDIPSGQQRQFTHGNQHDHQPVWSPKGDRIAFVSVRDKKTGVYLMPTTGGAEKRVIEIEGSIANLQWTPDAKALVFALRYNDSHYIKDEKKKKEQPTYRHITRLFYRLDAAGYLPNDRFQVYALDIETAGLRQITKGKRDNSAPAISPDGKLIAFVSNRSRDDETEPLRDDLFVIPFKGGKEKKVSTPAGPVIAPAFSPDSKRIAYLGHDNPDDGWGVTNVHIWTVGVAGKPKAKDSMPGFDRMTYDQSITDSSDAHESGSVKWSRDGKRLFFLSSDTGATNLYYVPARGGKPTRIFKGKCHLKGFSVNGKTSRAALIYAEVNNPGDIVTCPTQWDGEKKQIRHTDLNAWLRTEVKLGRTRDLMFKSFDGTQVQGWLVTPPDFKSTKKYPAILEIHGGPRVQYAHTFFHEMQYLAAKGYVVFYTNPRGGSGRGETWADTISKGWGELDYADCMAAADWMEKQKFIDPKRIGVTGGSYGGYMTNWIIGHTTRFRAAVTQRSIWNLESFVGASDIGFMLNREFDGFPWTNPKNYEKCSPDTYAKTVKTPTLIIHSEQDLRCNIEQGEQMYAQLKLMKKTVDFIRFPEEPHGLSRHGRPDRRIARLEFIEKWFRKYLK